MRLSSWAQSFRSDKEVGTYVGAIGAVSLWTRVMLSPDERRTLCTSLSAQTGTFVNPSNSTKTYVIVSSPCAVPLSLFLSCYPETAASFIFRAQGMHSPLLSPNSLELLRFASFATAGTRIVFDLGTLFGEKDGDEYEESAGRLGG